MEQQTEKRVKNCTWCHVNPTSNGRAFCDRCFSQPRRCLNRGCYKDADPYRVFCDDCYRLRNPIQSYKCRDCNNYIHDSKKILCDHCFNVSHRCLNVHPSGEECQDYTLGGRFLCVLCSQEKHNVNRH